MTSQNLFSKGFPTNRIPVVLPSTGRSIVLRETTVTELKSMCKVVIDNLDRRNMDVIYDAVTEYLNAMVLTDGVDMSSLTEFDRLYCLMVFFQMSFFKEPITYKCPHCGVDVVYRYDMSKYLSKMEGAYVGEQVVWIPYKSRVYEFSIGWPTVDTVSGLMHHFYGSLGEVTEEMERTQFGINFVFSFIKTIRIVNPVAGPRPDDPYIQLDELHDWQARLDAVNALPSMVVFDQEEGLFAKVTGYFVNRLENCFFSEVCPQCHGETNYGISQSSLFHALFYGSLRGMYGFILQVECLCLFRYDCCIFDKETCMTYNDLYNLTRQLGTTVERDNKERANFARDNITKGLWYIREILNTMIFPQDKLKH